LFVAVDRRTFLRTLLVSAGGLTAGGLLAGCSRSPQATGAAIPSGEAGISVENASYETLVGESRRLNLVVTENDRTPIEDAEVSVFVRSLEGEVRSGPHPTTWYPEDGEGTGTGIGIYQAQLPLTEPGVVSVVAVQGERWGEAAVKVITPEQSEVPVPGAPAIAVPTPTVTDPLGVELLCTEDPPCPLHEVSLDAALAEGRPVMLLFATPRYCVSTACGPAVGNLAQVHTERDWGRTAFIHCEIYPTEETVRQSFVQAVVDWGLPTEPWLFAIGSDGAVEDRLDGPMLAADVRRLAEALA
jgi:hypothetical protein